MRTRTLSRILRDQRGIALPMALLIVLTLSALMAAFSVLGASEPTLAANQQRVAQARAIAESGLERAIWALNNPKDASGIDGNKLGMLPNPAGPAPAPYDGSVLVPASLAGGTQVGGFRVTVTASVVGGVVVPSERNILVDGWVPNDTAPNRVKQRIQVTVSKIRFLDAPAPLAVRGELEVGGHSYIDARTDMSCGPKGGSWSKDKTDQGGSSKVYGVDDVVNGPNLDVANQPTLYSQNPAGDIVTNVPDAVFDTFTYSSDELTMLKTIAKANGTYYQGEVKFDASNLIPNGLVFVDTVSGQNITPSTPTSDFAKLRISGDAAEHVDAATGDRIFQGWIVVAGSARIDGLFQMHGLLYVQNDLTYMGIGKGQIVGAVISQNVRDTVSTSIDSDTGGNSTILWNCKYAQDGDSQVSQSFIVKLGSYRAVAG